MTHRKERAHPWAIRLACAVAALGGGMALTAGCGGDDTASISVDGGVDGSKFDASTGTDAAEVPDTATPVDAAPTCPSNQTMCGTTCTNTKFDPSNCGTCGTTCPSGQVCSEGACGSSCGAVATLCAPDAGGDGGAAYCALTQTDNANCGACGNACAAGQVCSAGKCGSSCGTGATLCTPDAGPAYCAVTQTDNANCGTCGNACPVGQVCSGGQCGSACGAGETLCAPDAGADGGAPYCANTQTDNANCGTCGTVCGAGDSCAAGQCVGVCPPSTPTLCGSGASTYCANTTNDVNNCNACGTVCATGATCTGSACVCPTGQTACGATMTSPGQCVVTAQCLTGAVLPTDCAQLHLLQPTLASGAYTIDPDGTAGAIAPYAVYCDMTSDGGGWTLALKADGTANDPNPARFAYTSSLWTTTNTADANYVFNTANPDMQTRVSAKYMSFNTLPYTQVRVGMSDLAGVGNLRYVQFSLPAASAYTDNTAAGTVKQTSLRATFASNTLIPAGPSPTRAEWLSLVSAPLMEPSCNLGGLNVDSTGGNASWARSRIGMLGNEQADCTSPDSYIGVGNAGNTCGSPLETVGNSAGCLPTPPTNGATAAFAYVFVRNTDFRTVVPAAASCAAHFAAGHKISGVYPLTYGNANTSISAYCDMTHAGGGWTMVYKWSTGLTGDAAALWTGGTATSESVPAQLGVASNYLSYQFQTSILKGVVTGPYVSRIVESDWNTAFTVASARVVAYNGEDEGASLAFKPPSVTSTTTWFNQANLTGSTWADVTVAGTYNFFSIAGDTANGGGRKWFVNSNYGGCTVDAGWLVAISGTGEGCAWDTQYYPSGAILYSPATTKVTWQSGAAAVASAMAVYVK